MSTLLEQARAESARGRHNYDHLVPVVHELRAKGWTYADIHGWLLDRKANVHRDAMTFAGAMSKRYRHWLKREESR